MFWNEIGSIPTINQIKYFTGSNPVLTTNVVRVHSLTEVMVSSPMEVQTPQSNLVE